MPTAEEQFYARALNAASRRPYPSLISGPKTDQLKSEAEGPLSYQLAQATRDLLPETKEGYISLIANALLMGVGSAPAIGGQIARGVSALKTGAGGLPFKTPPPVVAEAAASALRSSGRKAGVDFLRYMREKGALDPAPLSALRDKVKSAASVERMEPGAIANTIADFHTQDIIEHLTGPAISPMAARLAGETIGGATLRTPTSDSGIADDSGIEVSRSYEPVGRPVNRPGGYPSLSTDERRRLLEQMAGELFSQPSSSGTP